MLRKIILLLIISSIAIFGFAQKNKQKSNAKSSESLYFVMKINGEYYPDDTQAKYCPDDTITFDFEVNYGFPYTSYTYCWRSSYHLDVVCDEKPIKLTFPLINSYPTPNEYTVSVFFVINAGGGNTVRDTLTATINVDPPRWTEDIDKNKHFGICPCEGREITIPTNTHGDVTFSDLRPGTIYYTDWDTLKGASAFGCDSLVRWKITVDPSHIEDHYIKSCGDVKWGDIIIDDHYDYYETELERFFPAVNKAIACDTLKYLTVNIIYKPYLYMTFSQEAFCNSDPPSSVIDLTTNFTAFDWVWFNNRRATSFTHIEVEFADVEEAGNWSVTARMDTSVYKYYPDLRITNCSLQKDTLVEDCRLGIPDIITPNGDGMNDVLGIQKLNLDRENELIIYDRWGKNVWSQKDYQCAFRGGEYLNKDKDVFAGLSRGGQKLPDGTYYYSFMYDAFPKKIIYSGTIVILR